MGQQRGGWRSGELTAACGPQWLPGKLRGGVLLNSQLMNMLPRCWSLVLYLINFNVP